MKKNLYYFFAILLFVACSKEDNEDVLEEPFFSIENLVGGWAYDSIELEGETYLYPHREECYKDFIQFRHNEGQWYQFTETIFLDENCANESTNMEWQLKGKTLNLFFGEDLVISYEIITLTRNSLILLYRVDVDGDGKKEELLISTIPYNLYGEFH